MLRVIYFHSILKHGILRPLIRRNIEYGQEMISPQKKAYQPLKKAYSQLKLIESENDVSLDEVKYERKYFVRDTLPPPMSEF